MIEKIDTVVVGGGQAGLAMSYHLKQSGCEHVIFERGRAAQSWRSERWDSLMFQFPSSSIQLPGFSRPGWLRSER
jgi:putative flavoprotein involved in K+ transport